MARTRCDLCNTIMPEAKRPSVAVDAGEQDVASDNSDTVSRHDFTKLRLNAGHAHDLTGAALDDLRRLETWSASSAALGATLTCAAIGLVIYWVPSLSAAAVVGIAAMIGAPLTGILRGVSNNRTRTVCGVLRRRRDELLESFNDDPALSGRPGSPSLLQQMQAAAMASVSPHNLAQAAAAQQAYGQQAVSFPGNFVIANSRVLQGKIIP